MRRSWPAVVSEIVIENILKSRRIRAVTRSDQIADTRRVACPAQGLKIELYEIDGEVRTHLKTLHTNDDGRTDEQILPAEKFKTGTYELVFHAGDYLDP